MKFLLIVEGHTEKSVVPSFLARWLNSGERLKRTVGIAGVNLKGGGADLFDRMAEKARHYLPSGLRWNSRIIGVVGLLDLYNPGLNMLWPANSETATDRVKWGIEEVENRVNNPLFKMFFAVHEVEAWLLSQPENLPFELSKPDEKTAQDPEKIDFTRPPAKWLNARYQKHLKIEYKKIVNGKEIFDKLDPKIAREKCPYLKFMLDEMLEMAKQAGC